VLDADRSGLDPGDVAMRVLEHLRTLDPQEVPDASSNDRSELTRRALGAMSRAPFPVSKVRGTDATDRALRGYLSAFGVPSPPRLEPDRPNTDATLVEVISELPRLRPRPSLVYVWSPTPDPARRKSVVEALKKHVRRRVEFRWVRMRLDDGIARTGNAVQRAVGDAVALRARVAETAGEFVLRRMGATVERIRPLATVRSQGAGEGSPADA
jgi:hypothetical protein